MCIVAVVEHPTPSVSRLILHNRDESRTRPFSTGALHTIADNPVFYGIDQTAGGTWLTVSHDLFSAVINIRTPHSAPANPLTRGELPILAQSDPTRLAILLDTPKERARFRPFTLIQCRPTETPQSFNSLTGHTAVSDAALYTFTNHARREEEWFKQERIRELVKTRLKNFQSDDQLIQTSFDILEDRKTTEKPLPSYTGLSEELERRLSPIFVDAPERQYGTVVSTVVLYMKSGGVKVAEKNHLTGRTNQVVF